MSRSDLARYQGIGQFGSGYEGGMRNDSHAPGSVDRVLAERMNRLCSETAQYLYEKHTPDKRRYPLGARPELERHLEVATSGATSDEEEVEGICRFCRGLESRAQIKLDDMPFGGTEEEIIARGSDRCTDVVRVRCVLAQISVLPSRIASLFDLHRPNWGHGIIEVHRTGVRGATDPRTNIVYRHPDGRPTTTLELMNKPPLMAAHRRDEMTPYTVPTQ